MSTIFADKFKNTSGGNNVRINQLSGIDTAGSVAVQGEGTATTNLQQGLAKSWTNIQENYFQINYFLPNEDAEDYLTIKNNFKNIENYNFKEILKKYNSENYIIMIIFKRKNDIKTYSRINFDDKLLILNKNFKNKNIADQSDLNSIIFNIKNKYEDNWKSINKMNPSTSVPIRLSVESFDFKKSNIKD